MSFLSHPDTSRICILESQGNALPDLGLGGFASYVSFVSLRRALLAGQGPHTLIAWLMCPSYDAIELGAALVALGYGGRFVAVSPARLPNRQMVLTELQAACPSIQFEIWERPDHGQIAASHAAFLLEAI